MHSNPLLLRLSSLSHPSTAACPSAGCRRCPTCSPDGWVGCRCRLVGGWERRGVIHCLAGQHPLSSGAPSDGGVHWQSRILIWLCKYLLQKATRCNPYPVVERQSKEDRGKERKQQECREGKGRSPRKFKYMRSMKTTDSVITQWLPTYAYHYHYHHVPCVVTEEVWKQNSIHTLNGH